MSLADKRRVRKAGVRLNHKPSGSSLLSPNIRGMVALTASSCIFTFSDTLMKLATGTWPVSQSLAFRGVAAIVISLIAVHLSGQAAGLRALGNPLVLLRSFFEATVALMFILALSQMPIADLTAILMLSPAVITAGAALFYGEAVGWRRWSAIAAGFIGMLMVIQPGGTPRPDTYNFAALLGLGSVIGVAARDLTTLRLKANVPSVVVMFATAVGGCLAGVVLAPAEAWQPFAVYPALALVVAAGLVTGANFLLIISSRGVDLSAVAPFRYSAVIFAIIVGIVVFGDTPDPLAFAGMGVIVASGIYLMHRERVRRLARRDTTGVSDES